MDQFSEDALVEQPAIALLHSLGWESLNCYEETFGPGGNLGRDTSSEVVLVSRLRPVLVKLNSSPPGEAVALAIEELLIEHAKTPTCGGHAICCCRVWSAGRWR